VPVYVKMGVQRDAPEYAFRRELPAKRTGQDKRRDVEDCLERVPRASDRAIVQATGTSHTFVARVRAELSTGNGCQMEPAHNVFRGDSFYTQDTSRIGRGRKTK
jgi:hypothetical protein